MTTTFPTKPPRDVVTGDFRPLNLGAAPFSLPPPLRLIDERCRQPEELADKSLGVWEIAGVRSALGNRRG